MARLNHVSDQLVVPAQVRQHFDFVSRIRRIFPCSSAWGRFVRAQLRKRQPMQPTLART